MILSLDDKIRRFLKVYSNLPLAEAELPICVIDGKPFSWRRVAMEIEGKTVLYEKILDRLIEQELI